MMQQFIKPLFFLGIMAFAGCVSSPRLHGSCSLVVKPQFVSSKYIQALIPLNTEISIDTLVLRLFTLGVSNEESFTGVEKTFINSQLSNPLVLSNLKPNSRYRLKAYAYATGSVLISVDDPALYVDVALLNDDKPFLASIQVRLNDVYFSGTASSSWQIRPGAYLPEGPETLDIPFVGVVTTLAGNGTSGYINGVSQGARFNSPHDLALDSIGNIYVADDTNNAIRKVTPYGVVTTLAGNGATGYSDGMGTQAAFNRPISLTIDSQDNIIVADFANSRIRKITPAGAVSTLYGSGVVGNLDGTGLAAQFNGPHSLRYDQQGNLIVSDYYSHRIRKISPGGIVTTIAGIGTSGYQDGPGSIAAFKEPVGLAIDSQNNVYVADRGNHRIRKISSTGDVSTYAGGATSGYADGSATLALFNKPDAIAFDASGSLFVADHYNARIRVISPTGLVSTIAGNGTETLVDGVGSAASFFLPSGVAIGPHHTLYVTEMSNHCVRKIQ